MNITVETAGMNVNSVLDNHIRGLILSFSLFDFVSLNLLKNENDRVYFIATSNMAKYAVTVVFSYFPHGFFSLTMQNKFANYNQITQMIYVFSLVDIK